ncbi:MAG: hypothetical protein ACE148_16695 [Vicinamibacterales bacterium]
MRRSSLLITIVLVHSLAGAGLAQITVQAQASGGVEESGRRFQSGQAGLQGKLPVSLDRIKRGLDEPLPPLSSRPLKLDTVELPRVGDEGEDGHSGTTFRVRVEAHRFELPPLMETVLKEAAVPAVPGGLYHSEVMALITPPGFRGMEPYTNAEALQVVATSIAAALAMKGGAWAYGKAANWLRLQREAEARQQVQAELEEFKRQVGQDGKPTTPPKKSP